MNIIRLLFIILAWTAHTFGTEPPYADPPNDPFRFCVAALDRPGLDCYLMADVPEGSTIAWSGRESDLGQPPDGFQPFRDVTGPDGTVHTGCFIKVGDTSHLWCADGFATES